MKYVHMLITLCCRLKVEWLATYIQCIYICSLSCTVSLAAARKRDLHERGGEMLPYHAAYDNAACRYI